MEEQSHPDEPPAAEDALPGTDPDELREHARRLQEEAADRTRAAGELRDAAAALRGAAAALRERGPGLAEAEAADDTPAVIDGPSEESPGQPPAEDSPTPRRWFRRGGG